MYRAPTRREEKRGAWGDHKRLVYSFNVNRTSLDHLLLGKSADVDKSVEWAQYSAGWGIYQRKRYVHRRTRQ